MRRTIARTQLLNIPITVSGLLLIAVTGLMADRWARIPRPLYPLTFLSIMMVCYGVFVAYPSSGAVYAVTLIGNAFQASWFPIMWYVYFKFNLFYYPIIHTRYYIHISNPTNKPHYIIGHGESKQPPEQQDPPSQSDSSIAMVKSEVLLVHKCSKVNMHHVILFPSLRL